MFGRLTRRGVAVGSGDGSPVGVAAAVAVMVSCAFDVARASATSGVEKAGAVTFVTGAVVRAGAATGERDASGDAFAAASAVAVRAGGMTPDARSRTITEQVKATATATAANSASRRSLLVRRGASTGAATPPDSRAELAGGAGMPLRRTVSDGLGTGGADGGPPYGVDAGGTYGGGDGAGDGGTGDSRVAVGRRCESPSSGVRGGALPAAARSATNAETLG